jgi:hypothetical protein
MKKLIMVLAVCFIALFTLNCLADDTATPTPTFTATATYTATPSYFRVRVDGYAAWVADITGDTTGAVENYYKKATDCAGRNDTIGVAQAYFSAGHTQVKKFNSISNYNQTTKAIRLVLTPSAQKTVGALYAVSLTTSYTPLLDTAEIDLGNAAVVTGTSSAAATAVSNKIKNDLSLITAVRAWIAAHL